KQFNNLAKTAKDQIDALTVASALSTGAKNKINTSVSFFTTNFPGRFSFSFDAASKLFSSGLEFDLKASKSLNLDFADLDGIGSIPLSFESGGTLNIDVGAALRIDFGIDGAMLASTPLSATPLSAFFLFPTSQLSLTAKIDAHDLQAKIDIGGV